MVVGRVGVGERWVGRGFRKMRFFSGVDRLVSPFQVLLGLRVAVLQHAWFMRGGLAARLAQAAGPALRSTASRSTLPPRSSEARCVVQSSMFGHRGLRKVGCGHRGGVGRKGEGGTVAGRCAHRSREVRVLQSECLPHCCV